MKITLTRRSIVGFGYTSACEQAWNKSQTESYLRVCDVERPDYIGTVRQVSNMIAHDRTLKSFDSGGTYYTTQWFVRVKGAWKKIVNDSYVSPAVLMETIHDWSTRTQSMTDRYVYRYVTVEVE